MSGELVHPDPDDLAAALRREAQAAPQLSAVVPAILAERIAALRGQVLALEADQHADWMQVQGTQKLLRWYMQDFSALQEKAARTPDERFRTAFKAALADAIRTAGPEATLAEFLPVLGAALNEFGV